MLKKFTACIVILTLLLAPSLTQGTGGTNPVLVGKYEVSYMLNAMYGGGAGGAGNPVDPNYFCGSAVGTAPVMVSGLQAGSYLLRIVPGRETGNPGCEPVVTNWWWLVLANNPSAVPPNTGYDGGNTAPEGAAPPWNRGVYAWVGGSPTNGTKYSVGDQLLFQLQAGQNIWLYHHDWYIDDNLGGTTVELWRIGSVQRQISAFSDDVNEDGGNFRVYYPLVWVGTGANVAQSFTGLRFNNLPMPNKATITEAYLEVYSPSYSWIRIDLLIAADASGDSPPFRWVSRPSLRWLTMQKVEHHSNRAWSAGSWNRLGNVTAIVQEVVNRPDWQTGHSLSLILKGIGKQWGRKFVASYEGDPMHAARLVIRYVP
jgi:hypothetical protein